MAELGGARGAVECEAGAEAAAPSEGHDDCDCGGPAGVECAAQGVSECATSASTSCAAEGHTNEALPPPTDGSAPVGPPEAGPWGQDAAAYQSFVDYYTQYTREVCSLMNHNNGEPGGQSDPAEAPPDAKRALVEKWLQRPARVQADPKEMEQSAHLEGRDEYNIWYGRHMTDRSSRQGHMERDAALTRCDPERDAGYTAAGTGGGSFFCAFFAKGCCTKGSECLYRHVLPVRDDEGSLDWSRDVFGRERHREHRDDMGGVGSFNHDCKTLFVGGLTLDPTEQDGLKKLEAFLWDTFGVWGDLRAVRVIPKKLIGFVTYEYRVQAEFAKVAMADQNVGKYGAVLTVKWAHHAGGDDRRNAADATGRAKRPRVGAAAEPSQEEARGAAAQQALASYCAAWQQYWVSTGVVPAPADAAGGEQGLLPDQGAADTEEARNAQKLQAILSKVDGLSAADFLAPCGDATNVC